MEVTLKYRPTRNPKRQSLKFLERTLWAAGLIAVGYVLWTWGDSYLAQQRGASELAELMEFERSRPAPSAGAGLIIPVFNEGDVVGMIRIPKVGIDTVVFEGTTSSTLSDGVGHLRSSPVPPLSGNVVLAAHRDTYFRPLKDVAPGDEIVLETPHGSVRYRVSETWVVEPTSVEVLEPTDESVLTLITCYPFYYVGHAPQRFIVRAEKIS